MGGFSRKDDESEACRTNDIRAVVDPIRSLPLSLIIQVKATYALCATVLSVIGPVFDVA